EISRVERNPGGAALEREGARLLGADERVVQLDRLEHGAQLVIPVGADAQHAKIEVDLGVGSCGQLEALTHVRWPDTASLKVPTAASQRPQRPRRSPRSTSWFRCFVGFV